jgi:hypothetical protein
MIGLGRAVGWSFNIYIRHLEKDRVSIETRKGKWDRRGEGLFI